jgi:anti-anti-sigma factor
MNVLGTLPQAGRPPGAEAAGVVGAVEKVFRVALQSTDGAQVVVVTGELDVATVPELERVLAALSGRVVIECSALTFMDAGAMGALVRASNRLDDLTLINVDPFIRKLLELVQLHTLLLEAGPADIDESDVPTPPPVARSSE